jgi:hypothetical protein
MIFTPIELKADRNGHLQIVQRVTHVKPMRLRRNSIPIPKEIYMPTPLLLSSF